MSRTGWTVIGVLVMLLAAVVVLERLTRPETGAPPPEADAPGDAATADAAAADADAADADAADADAAAVADAQVVTLPAGLRTLEVVLYFGRPDGRGLAPQSASIFETASLLDRLKQTVVALTRGPAPESPLLPVLPEGTPLRDLFLDGEGTLYLDLGQRLLRGLPPGSMAERLAVGSLTTTLIVNFPEVRKVRILIEGEEVATLGGHLDLGRALEADRALILPEEQ